jgi:hypothetical protein
VVDNRSEIREFLTSRRARITPQEAGLPVFGGTNRRVAGLRREEVAMLAGVSIDYYTRLERGALGGVSEGCSMHWPTRCSSTTPSGRTCSTWAATPAHRSAADAGAPRSTRSGLRHVRHR